MTKVPTWFWLAAVAALLWSIAGCAAYLSQVSMSADDIARLPAAQRDIWAMMPAWVTGAYATAVWGSLAASVALLLRRRVARLLFLVSLVAVVAQFGWTFLASPILATMGAATAVPFPALIVAIGVAELWFADFASRRAWLR